MLLDQLCRAGVPVMGIGKISDIFLNRGISESLKTKNNSDGMQRTVEAMRKRQQGLIFVNLVDFDQQFGHRNDVEGYAQALEAVDSWLPNLPLNDRDLVILTADHGCDPTILTSTDHSREYVPILAWGPNLGPGRDLGTRSSFGDMGVTILDGFGLPSQGLVGESFADILWKEHAKC